MEEELCIEMEEEVQGERPNGSSAEDPVMQESSPSPPTTRSRKREKSGQTPRSAGTAACKRSKDSAGDKTITPVEVGSDAKQLEEELSEMDTQKSETEAVTNSSQGNNSEQMDTSQVGTSDVANQTDQFDTTICGEQPVANAQKRKFRRNSACCRPAEEFSPLVKLTTRLRRTYDAITMKIPSHVSIPQSLYKQKQQLIVKQAKTKGVARNCHLWKLMKRCQMFREQCYSAFCKDSTEPEMVLRAMNKFLTLWLQQHRAEHSADCMGVEIDYERTVNNSMADSSFKLYCKIDLFLQALEKRKSSNGSLEDQQGNYLAEVGEPLGIGGRYVVLSLVGGGAFCKCWLSFDRQTCRRVCVKITCNRKHCFEQSRREVKTLRYLNTQHPEAAIVKLLHSFVHSGHQALVFEHLAYDLYLLLKNESFRGLSLTLVRKFGIQLLPTLKILSASCGVNLIHCDLKPENIMVVDRKRTKINIIDFGSSCFGGEHGSSYIQSRFYRAPEVLIGSGYSTQIDMWSVGCILFELYTGRPIFNGKTPQDQMMKICTLLGQPPAHMMQHRRFFLSGTKEGERLESMPKEVSFQDRFRAVGYACISRRKRGEGVSLSDEIKTDDTGRVTDEVLLHFIDLITRCLELDPDKRLTPSRALRHRFWSTGINSKQVTTTTNQEPATISTTGCQPSNSTAAAQECEASVPEADNEANNRADNLSSQQSLGSGVTGMQQAMAKATLNSGQTTSSC